MFEWHYAPTGEEWITSSTNEERADRAEAAVERFRNVCSGDNDLTAIYDLICDLGHLFDRLAATTTAGEEIESFEMLLDRALYHYNAERGEGDDIEQSMRR